MRGRRARLSAGTKAWTARILDENSIIDHDTNPLARSTMAIDNANREAAHWSSFA
jgi:hypothetical protein